MSKWPFKKQAPSTSVKALVLSKKDPFIEKNIRQQIIEAEEHQRPQDVETNVIITENSIICSDSKVSSGNNDNSVFTLNVHAEIAEDSQQATDEIAAPIDIEEPVSPEDVKGTDVDKDEYEDDEYEDDEYEDDEYER